MANELKPCPFCEGKAVFVRTTHHKDNIKNMQYQVYCNNCSASSGHTIEESTAIENWNRRATDVE